MKVGDRVQWTGVRADTGEQEQRTGTVVRFMPSPPGPFGDNSLVVVADAENDQESAFLHGIGLALQ